MTILLESWRVRPQDASVQFSGRASRLLPTVRARFTAVTGTVSGSAVEVDVDVRSLTTGNRAYDDLLAVADPFDAARHPVATYRSDAVLWVDDRAVVTGALTLRGRTGPVQLAAEYVVVEDGVARLTATGRVDRRVFGLRLEVPGCGALVPSHLDLSISVTAEQGDSGADVGSLIPEQRGGLLSPPRSRHRSS